MEDALAILQAENAVLRAQLAERNAALDVANAQIEALTFNLAVLRRRQFGQSSERLAAEIEQLELRLEDLEESRAEQRAEQPESEQPDPVTRKSRKRYANSGGLDGVAHVSEGRRGTQCANLHTIEGVTMADDAKTWIEFEVLQCEETGFRVAGESEAVGWLSFDIRQPRYPRRSADITIIHSQGPTPGSAGSSASQDGASPSPNETTRKSFSNNMIGALVVRSREKSAIVRADLPIGVFEYSQTWTIGDHTESLTRIVFATRPAFEEFGNYVTLRPAGGTSA